MNTHKLKPGDRVHLAPWCHLSDYQPSAAGVVVQELAPGAFAPRYFRVVMDKDWHTGKTVIVSENEIEPDV